MKVSPVYDASGRTLTLKVSQHIPATPGQAHKKPVPIPLAVGLLASDGSEMPLHLKVHIHSSAMRTFSKSGRFCCLRFPAPRFVACKACSTRNLSYGPISRCHRACQAETKKGLSWRLKEL